MPKHLLSSSWCSSILAVILAQGAIAPAGMQAQDTIQLGPLKPLQTLPSLGSPAPVFPKTENPAAAPAAAPGLPTMTLPPMGSPGPPPPGGATMPQQQLGSPLTPPSSVPTMTLPPGVSPVAPPPVPLTATPPPAATPPSAAPPAAPPPLPASSTVTITGPVAQGYLYIEPYQTRFEALFDAATVLSWLNPEAALPESLSAEQQKQIVETMASRSSDWCALSVGDHALPVPLPMVAVIKGLPGNTLPLKEGEDVALNQALVGFMWEFATPPGPDEMNVTWKGWIKDMTKLPIRVFFGPLDETRLSETGEIYSTIKNFRWRNQGRMPRPAPLAAVPHIPLPQPLRLPVGGILWVVSGLVFYIWLKVKNHRLPGGSLPYFFVWLLGGVLMSQLLVVPVDTEPASPPITQVEEAQKIVSPLLRNVYRAFDHHAESDVYDVLARSVEGELLRKLYLETIQALTLDGREGTRVTITGFSANVDKVEPNPKGPGFVADCNWMARGIVGHWGHSHPRVNIYNARITVTPVKDEWKLTGLEVQEVRRL